MGIAYGVNVIGNTLRVVLEGIGIPESIRDCCDPPSSDLTPCRALVNCPSRTKPNILPSVSSLMVASVHAEADALHVATASVHSVDYLLTWNCRHIDNAATKPIVRSICAVAGYDCPEICTLLELLSEETENVQG